MLTSRLFSGNRRLVAASDNNPAMRRGERDEEAVRLIQQALRDLEVASMRMSIRSDGTFDGDYGGETYRGVKRFQEQKGLEPDGIIGPNTMRTLDRSAAARGLTPMTAVQAAAAPPPVETPSTLPAGTPRLPSAARLRQEYQAFVADRGKPCQATLDGAQITHQCAIRLNIALHRCEIGFHLTPSRRGELYVHAAYARRCGGDIDAPHDASARRTFNYIRQFWNFTPYRLDRTLSGAQVYDRVQGTPAIIFFDRLSGGTNHIDYFDGTRIMNDELNYAAPGEPRGRNPNTTFADTQRAIHVLPLPR